MDESGDSFHRAFVARNWAFLSDQDQLRLAQASVLVAGVGLGSAVAQLLVRSGVGHIIVADGDSVEISNLNRQFYTCADLGTNKAIASSSALTAINPAVVVTTVSEYLQVDSIVPYVDRADIVVNTIDWDHPAQLACLEAARERGKHALFPMNVGFGSAVFVFAPTGPTLEEVAGARLTNAELKRHFAQRAYAANVGGEWQPLMQLYEQSLDGGYWPSDPQLGVAVAATAALTVTACIRILLGQRVRSYPEPIVLDLLRAMRVAPPPEL